MRRELSEGFSGSVSEFVAAICPLHSLALKAAVVLWDSQASDWCGVRAVGRC